MVMKKYLLRFSIVLITGFFIVLGSKKIHNLTGGFRMDKVSCPKARQLIKQETCKHLNENQIEEIFSQKYKYWDKGCQVYVFQSEDQKYVIKFLRYNRYKPRFWMVLGKEIPFLRKKIDSIIEIKKSRLINNLNSYYMSYFDLRDQTETIYVHLDKTKHLNKSLVIENYFGNKKKVNLDDCHFIVQKKAENYKKKLLELYREEKIEEIKKLFKGYFETVQNRCLKGISNCDHSGYIRNMGIIENKVIEIDIGGYRKNENRDKLLECEYRSFRNHLKRWVSNSMPKLTRSVDEIADEVYFNKAICR